MEQVISIPGSQQMNRVPVRRGLVVEKSGIATGAIALADGHERSRGCRLEYF